jgi:hypothetical protein
MADSYCERCGESYNQDNLDTCVRCHRDVCPRCASKVSQRDGLAKWMCEPCAREEGLMS